MQAADVRNNMKKLVIRQFYDYLDRWSKGHYDASYQPIMHKILFIESFEGLDNLDSVYDKLSEL